MHYIGNVVAILLESGSPDVGPVSTERLRVRAPGADFDQFRMQGRLAHNGTRMDEAHAIVRETS